MAARGGKSRLKAYRRKRNFEVTSEPADTAPAPRRGDGPSFVVHKHDARRLHYDLRLEMDGALASWAIPKGFSFDPKVKRLAVQTEDHPLAYASFEGLIPKGEYGGGESLLWDRGTFDTVPPGQASAQRKKGHLHLRLWGEKLRGEWHLVRTRASDDKTQWLCFKAKDGTEDPSYDVLAERPESVATGRRLSRDAVPGAKLLVPAPPPKDIQARAPEVLLDAVWPPMTATLSTPESAAAETHVFELKYDGYRGLAAVGRGELAFVTRNRLPLESRFPELARALRALPLDEAVLDGEVVALDARGVSRFQQLHDGADRRFVVFDLLWLHGQDLRRLPLEQRRSLLELALSKCPPPVVLAERVAGSVEHALAEVKRRGAEGLIAKRKGSTYQGTRSRDWLKLKVLGAQEAAIVGYTPSTTGKREIGALLLGVYEGGVLRYAGKVGTGFTLPMRRQLLKLLSVDQVKSAPVAAAPRMKDAHWVKPRRVAQVAFSEWTVDGRMRHPSFQGIREDKTPEQCVLEKPQAAAPEVKLSSGTKVLFPKSGITKAEVFEYYRDVARWMVPALRGRPLSFQQWPHGIEQAGVFRQHVPHIPDWLTTVEVPHKDRTVRHVVVDRPESLHWLANQNALTLHMWASRVPHLDDADWVVFDMDPGTGSWGDLIQVTLALRGLLEELNLTSVPKTSGQRGLHVFVPLGPGHSHAQAVDFAVAITQTLGEGLPTLATTERMKAKRHGRLYLDAFQNGKGKTVVAPYSLRAKEGAPVSTPLEWSEVTPALDPQRFNLRTARARFEAKGDLFEAALRTPQTLPPLKRNR